MKNNWGTYIAIVYTIFAASMIFMLLRSCGVSSPLIEDDYYNKELQFNKLKTYEQNVLRINAIPVFSKTNNKAVWTFMETANKGANGVLKYKHLQEPNYDQDSEFMFDSITSIEMPIMNFNKGLYQVEILWSNGEDTFYNLQKIKI